jgi:site-specific DNA recombinase
MYSRNAAKPQERVALYARVSSQMQVEDGISIAAQLAEMREFAVKRNWAVTAEFVDAGLSGQTLERQGLQSMLSAVRAGSIDVVLVHELSRLSRRAGYRAHPFAFGGCCVG